MAGTPSRRRVARMDGTASALAPASKVSATTRLVVGMTVQSLPASPPVTGRVPGDAGLVADGRGDGGTVPGVSRGEVRGGVAEGAATLGAGVVPVPWCAPGEGVPPQAASAVTAAPATASRVISEVLISSACAGPGGPERSEGPVSGVDGHQTGLPGPRRGTPGVLAGKPPDRPCGTQRCHPLVPMEGMKNEPDRAVPAGHQPARWPARRWRRGSGWRRCACSGVRIPRADGPRHSAPAVPVFGPAP